MYSILLCARRVAGMEGLEGRAATDEFALARNLGCPVNQAHECISWAEICQKTGDSTCDGTTPRHQMAGCLRTTAGINVT